MESFSEELEALQSIFTDEITVEEKGDVAIIVYNYNSNTQIKLEINKTTYPSSLPVFVLPKHLESLGLLTHLASKTTPLIGSPMLYAIIDTVKDWLDAHPLSVTTPTIIDKSMATPTDSGVTVCKFYIQGKCRFGDQCKNKHPGGGETKSKTDSHTAVTAKTDTQTTPTKTDTRSKSKSKNKTDTTTIDTTAPSPSKKSPARKQQQPHNVDDEEEEETTKKDKMRTATEVISRILWDPDLPSEEFTVGYLDRFIGIQEKPFKEFSWEDIASVGANVLAVPKHRIQYFKYNDIIVWDKRSQTDNFFGSRGGSTIQELVSKMQQQKDGGNATKDSNKDTEGELSLMDIDDSTDDKTTPHYRTDINRPTHFICLHVNSEEVVQEVQKVVSHITHLNPQLGECLIKLPALHVTLCMARLTNDEQIERAKQVLLANKLQFISLLPSCVKLSFTGVDNFRERLIYIKIKPEPALSKFVSHIIEQLQTAGLKTPGNHEEYTPHITIVKLSRPMQRELKTDVINPACYQPFLNTSLGQQPITSIHLCAMHAPAQEDGFYLRYSTLTNSLLGLPSSFMTLIENQFGLLADMGYLNESDRDQFSLDIKSCVQTQDEDKFDEIIEELMRLNKEASTFESLTTPTVIIMRGIPGSGKSYLAHHCQEVIQNPHRTAIISADDYFTEGSEYHFNPATAYKAHQYCIERFLSSLAGGCKLVIIDNTNTQLWEYRIYTHICDILGYAYHILEIPLHSPSLIDMARSRNIHNIQSNAITKMVQRWDQDERSVLVPPKLGYPRAWPSKEPPVYSITSFCTAQTTNDTIKNFDVPHVPIYTGIFLTIESQWELLKTYRPAHSELFGTHVTLIFKPNLRQIRELPIGKKIKIQVAGESDNGRIQAAVVELPSHVTSENKSPHVTISTVHGIPPKIANAMLQSKLIRQNQTIYLEGTVGLVVRESTDEERTGQEFIEGSLDNKTFHTITSPSTLKTLLPNLILPPSQEGEKDELTTPISHQSSGILIGVEQKITQLFIFDFDGTLFIPPGNYQGRRDYERLTGKKWHRKGWLSHADSLLPPLKVHPGPALADFRSHANRAGSLTLVMTGRVDKVRPGLGYVLEKAQIFPERIICKPDVTDESTSSYKQRKVKELLTEFPDVTLVKFWDDIPENLSAIRYLSQGKASHVQFDIIDATKMSDIHDTIRSPKKPISNSITRFGSNLQAHLVLHGLLPTLEHTTAIQEGLEFIATQFAEVIQYKGNPLNLTYPFGSSPLHRVSDVDVCLLAPPTHTHIEWITLLEKKLESCGINYTNIGHSSRCPRLTVLLHFSQTPSIEYDIIIALVPNEELFKNPTDRKIPAAKISEMRQGGDSVTKVALSGPLFLERIESISKSTGISMDKIGAVIEFILQLLMAKREKGNAYHCIRTFHIMKLLIDFIETNHLNSISCDQLFVTFINHLSLLTFEDWKSTCNEFVPEEYLPRYMSLFKDINTQLREVECPNIECYEEMLTRSVFPPEGYTPVEIRLSGNDNLKKWKAKLIIEARLPTYIRQLITRGLDVVSNGNKNNNRFCFAVPSLKSSKETLQQILRPFWTEMADLKKGNGININLTFGLPTDVTNSLPTASDARTAAIMESITSFVSSDQKEFHLPSSLSAHTRLLVHEAVESLGLIHSSVGKGNNRHIVLKKL